MRSPRTAVLIAIVAVLVALGRSFAAQVATPTFSQKHGFYSSSFSVKISTATSGATIRYTTDGSKPTASSGTVLANGGSVSISRTTPLRAVGCMSGYTTSQPFTQTYIFLSDILTQTRPSGYPTTLRTDEGTFQADYDMDPVIVNHTDYKSTIQNDLKTIPSLSIVLPKNKLFGNNGDNTGVYCQGGGAGGENTLEVECSLELINPDGVGGFQIDCGLKGHTSIGKKRSFRLLFKTNYGGPQKLNYPFFERAPLHASSEKGSYGKIFLRMQHNEWYGKWGTGYYGTDGISFMRDETVRAAFTAMRGYGTRGTFMHVYLNGMYWGVYNPMERPDARWAADYFGGAKSDWFAANMEIEPYDGGSEIISGSRTRHDYLHNTLVPGGGFANASKYNTVKQYLDIEHFCDYIIANWYAGRGDWPRNNYYVVNRNNPAQGLLYQHWDADVSWQEQGGAHVPAPFYTSSHSHYNAYMCKLWRALDDNVDFKMTFADQVYTHCFNDGALTEANQKARFDKIANYLERAVVGETARWGDVAMADGLPRFTLNGHWKPARTKVRNLYTGNVGRFITALRNNSPSLYPSLNPPTFSQHGGTVASGYKLTINRNNSSGTIYYRTDGDDPRVAGGGILDGSSTGAATAVVTLSATTTVKARVKNGATWSALANAKFTVTGSSVPAAPSSLTAAAPSSTAVTLGWTDNSGNETGFKIERSLNGSTWSQISTAGANATAYTDSGLSPATQYYYRVRAYNSAGNSGYSNTANTTTPDTAPAAPSGLAAAALSTSQIRVTWVDNSSNETQFKIRWGTSVAAMDNEVFPAANTTSWTHSGLSADTTYYYRIRSENAAGVSAYTAEVSAKTSAGLPAAPSSLTAAALSASQIRIAWTDNSGNETGFKIDRRQSGASEWVRVATPGANTTAYTDSGLPAATEFYYQVKAYNAAGDSGYSNVAGATTEDTAPAAPSGLAAVALSTSQIRVTWVDNSSNETQFKIRWGTSVAAMDNEVFPAANTTSWTHSGLSADATYYYKIRSENAAGVSAYTAEVSAKTSTGLPAAPSSLTAAALSASQIRIAWTDNSGNETGFKIDRRQSGASDWVRVAEPGANATTYTDSGLPAATEFYYQVKAYNAAGNSDYSNVAGATTEDTLPADPTNPQATAVSSTEITFTWTDNADNEEQFQLRRSLDGVDWYALPAVFLAADVTRYSDTGLAPGTTYWYKVKAKNSAGESAYTAPVSATTPVDTPAQPSGLAANALSSTEIKLSWIDTSDNETRFKIRRSLDGTDFDTLSPLYPAANATTATDSGLTAGTTCYYKIRSENSVGVSPYTAPVSATTPVPLESFTAYNDLAWFAGQPAANVTTFTTTNAFAAGVPGGQLVDYGSGQPLEAHLTVTGGNGVIASQGLHPAAGTDAHAVFDGKVDASGTVSYGTEDFILTLSALDPALRYELVLYADRNKGSYVGAESRYLRATLAGAASFANASSAGTTVSTDTAADDTTVYNAGYNNVTGYVARFRNIDPGPDGTVVLVLSQDTAQACYTYANALMLKAGKPDAPVEKIAKGAVWKYRKGTAEASSPADAWRAAGFDDSAWAAGATPLGYGDANVAYGTELADMQTSYTCVFMRKTFSVSDPAVVNGLQLDVRYDDAFILWINGEEVARVNMAGTSGEAVAHDAEAAENVSDTWTATLDGGAIPALVAGPNVVALQVFNRSLTSGDLTVDVALAVTRQTLPAAEDTDADVLPDAWEEQHLGNTSQPPDGDYDGDGVSNREEYILGTNPADDTDWFGVDLRLSGGKLMVAFDAVAASGTGYAGLTRHYALEQKAAGGGENWVPVAGYEDIVGTGQTVTYQPAGAEACAFYRVKVWLD